MKALLINPTFPESYWNLRHALPMLGIKYWQPPLPLLTVAALLPTHWSLRLIDENVNEVTDDDLLGADVIMLTGMIVQRGALWTLLERCRALASCILQGRRAAHGVDLHGGNRPFRRDDSGQRNTGCRRRCGGGQRGSRAGRIGNRSRHRSKCHR